MSINVNQPAGLKTIQSIRQDSRISPRELLVKFREFLRCGGPAVHCRLGDIAAILAVSGGKQCVVPAFQSREFLGAGIFLVAYQRVKIDAVRFSLEHQIADIQESKIGYGIHGRLRNQDRKADILCFRFDPGRDIHRIAG